MGDALNSLQFTDMLPWPVIIYLGSLLLRILVIALYCTQLLCTLIVSLCISVGTRLTYENILHAVFHLGTYDIGGSRIL